MTQKDSLRCASLKNWRLLPSSLNIYFYFFVEGQSTLIKNTFTASLHYLITAFLKLITNCRFHRIFGAKKACFKIVANYQDQIYILFYNFYPFLQNLIIYAKLRLSSRNIFVKIHCTLLDFEYLADQYFIRDKFYC